MSRVHQAAALAAALLCSTQASALNFNFTFLGGTSAQAQAGFLAAGERWSAALQDDVTVDMTVGFTALSPGVMTSTAGRRVSLTYSSFRDLLAADRTSAADTTAGAHLSAGSSFGLLINRTSDNPNGSGSATPYVDNAGANNTTVNLTSANVKALSGTAGSGTVGSCVSSCDGSLVLNSSFAFDFNSTDGIDAGTYDFVGIATREIGRTLGFVSGVDILDLNSPPVNGPFLANQFTFVSSVDLFRYSTLSLASGVVDFTADSRVKYFSIDGGATAIATFSSGRNFGDGGQAGNWKGGLGLGIMDWTFGAGNALRVGANDLLAMDVMGWDLAAPVPEPETYAMWLLGLLALGLARRRQR